MLGVFLKTTFENISDKVTILFLKYCFDFPRLITTGKPKCLSNIIKRIIVATEVVKRVK